MFTMCTLIPIIAVVLCGYRNLDCKGYLKKISIYVLVCNGILFTACSILYKGASIVSYMEQYLSFSIQYMTLNTVLAMGIYLLDKCFLYQKKIQITISPRIKYIFNKFVSVLTSKKLFFVITVLICLCNAAFLVDNAVWGDEGFSVVLIRRSIRGVLEGTAADVHPPLYYLILKLMVTLFGEKGVVLHLTSYLAFIGICVLIMTFIRKNFGLIPAYIAIILTGWTGTGMVYSVEIRMYSMALFFVTATFCAAYKVLTTEACKYWIYMAVFALLGAYTHYFALLEVAFLIFAVYVAALVKRQKGIWKKIIVTAFICIIGYMPWLISLITTLGRTVESFWLQVVPSFTESMDLLFGMMSYSRILFLSLIVLLLLYMISHIVRIQSEPDSTHIHIECVNEMNVSILMVWISVWTILGTTIFGILFSKTIRPVMLTRYLFPMTVMAGTSLGIMLMYFTKKKRLKGIVNAAAVLLILVMGITGMQEYTYRYQKYVVSREETENTLKILDEYAENGYLIVSDIDHFNWTVLEYYYPGMHDNYNILPENSYIKKAVALMADEISEEEQERIANVGYVISSGGEGRLDNTSFYIYYFVRD